MAKKTVSMPQMGESIIECTVLKWLVNIGDFIKADDMILEVATDKIDTEIGSSYEGILTEILVKEGEIAKIGNPICILETEAKDAPINVPESIPEILEKEIIQIKETLTPAESPKFYSPLVQTIAQKENISSNELSKISGTGQNNRVTKDDILAYVEARKEKPTQIGSSISETDTVVEMDRMRKMIAERMVASKKIAPHVTSFIETDMSKAYKWREAEKDLFRAKYHTGGLTFTPLLVEAVCKAILKYPGINIQVDGHTIIHKKDINIGVAVALPNGNLIVPVVHRADKLSLAELALKISDLAKRARQNELKPDELQGGTYTISNIGSFGNLSGTPIILQPQVAIMAFGVIRKMPAVIETAEGDVIAIRQKMIISHSYDHRVIDGSLGGLFLKEVSDNLEKIDTNRTFR
jgi:2-oxoglutarate dehydrogenase E2 component (dihydrolipoamide succinyltransferase)